MRTHRSLATSRAGTCSRCTPPEWRRPLRATEGLKNVVGSNRVPEWHSPAPRNESAADIDLDSWRLLHRMGAMGSVGRLWLGCMFSCPRRIVKNIACFGDQWFWVLSDSGAVGAFGWPVEAIAVGDELYHTVAPKSSAQAGILLHIYDLNQWIVCEIEWESPLGVRTRCGPGERIPLGPLARQVSPQEPLLQLLARKGFHDMSKTALGMLAKAIGCDVEPADTLLVRCRRMMRHVLGDPVSVIN